MAVAVSILRFTTIDLKGDEKPAWNAQVMISRPPMIRNQGENAVRRAGATDHQEGHQNFDVELLRLHPLLTPTCSNVAI